MTDYAADYRADLRLGIPKTVIMTSVRQRIQATQTLPDGTPDKAEALSGLTAFLDELERTPDADDIR